MYLNLNWHFFIFTDTATTEIYTLSLHDALPIWSAADPGAHRARGDRGLRPVPRLAEAPAARRDPAGDRRRRSRSEEHTSELQSRRDLVCRLLLEKKK